MKTLFFCLLTPLFLACKTEVAPAQLVPVAEALPVNHPPLNVPDVPLEGLVGRKPKRLSVDQLNASILAATGIAWTDTINGVPKTNVLNYLAPTLGRPDYAQITHDSLDPNVMFAKFVGDGARKVCSDLATNDKGSPADKRVLVRVAGATEANNLEAVNKNVIYLRTRFLGDDASGFSLTSPFVKVFQDTVSGGGTADDGWLAVCVAMMTDPLFLTY
jgi:hypothetical protein